MKTFALALAVLMQFAPCALAQDKPAQAAPVDEDYAWDAFYHRGRLIWECRGIHTGTIVAPDLCAFQQKVDARWPDKKIPAAWKPQ